MSRKKETNESDEYVRLKLGEIKDLEDGIKKLQRELRQRKSMLCGVLSLPDWKAVVQQYGGGGILKPQNGQQAQHQRSSRRVVQLLTLPDTITVKARVLEAIADFERHNPTSIVDGVAIANWLHERYPGFLGEYADNTVYTTLNGLFQDKFITRVRRSRVQHCQLTKEGWQALPSPYSSNHSQ